MTLRNSVITIIVAVWATAFVRCSNLVDGGSSVSGNGRVVGSLFYGTGNPAKNARAYLVPVGYNPRRDAALPVSHTVTTDLKGTFSFAIADSGYFNIQATDADQKTVLIRGIGSFGNSITLSADTLRTAGAVKVMLPDSIDSATGFVYIPGTTLFADARGAQNRYVVIGGVPPGSIPGVSLAANATSAGSVLKPDFIVTSGDTVVIVNQTWRYKAKLFLNTTARGAGVYGTVFDFPVYVILTSWNFDFNEAAANGEDVRFTKSDGMPLVHEIGQWNVRNGLAEVWVKVDTIVGNSAQQYILMYWGNSDAADNSDGGGVFPIRNGFQGVWHLAAENGSDSARDATANHYTGNTRFMRAPIIDPLDLGIGRPFDGAGCIVMPQTAASSLSMPPYGSYTISAWVYVETLDTAPHVIAGMDGRYALYLRSLQGTSRWEFVNFADTAAASWRSVIDDIPVRYGEWSYLTGVYDGAEQYLYVNERRVQSLSLETPAPASLPRNSGRDFSIGGFLSNDQSGTRDGFKGIIDEVRFENVARNAEWIRLNYENQQFIDSLVIFKKQ